MRAKLLESFSTLNGASRDLWLVFILKFLESYSYFSMSLVLTMFLSQEFKLSDSHAGFAYGTMGSLTSIYGLLVGSLIDKWGVRQSLLTGIIMVTFFRTVMVFTTSRLVLYFSIFFGLPLGGCLIIPVLTLAIRRYTTTSNRGFAFGLFYSIMNLGALFSGFVVDGLSMLIDPGTLLGLTANRWVFVTGMICSLAMIPLALAIQPEVPSTQMHDMSAPPPPADKSCVQLGPWTRSAREIWALRSFWRFLALTLITVNLRSIFR